jgi:hypothetical protein
MNKPQEMNSTHATAFLLFGSAMTFLPFIYPELFASTSATRLLWLQIMGTLNACLGLGWHTIDFVQANLALLDRRHAILTGELAAPAPKPSAALPYWSYWDEQRLAQ